MMLAHHQIACVQLSEIRGIDYAVTHNEVPPTARDLPSLTNQWTILPQWTFHQFIFQSKRFYAVLLCCRVLAFLVVEDNICKFAKGLISTSFIAGSYHPV